MAKNCESARKREYKRNGIGLFLLRTATVGLIGVLPLEIISEIAKMPDPHLLTIGDVVITGTSLVASGGIHLTGIRDRRITDSCYEPGEQVGTIY